MAPHPTFSDLIVKVVSNDRGNPPGKLVQVAMFYVRLYTRALRAACSRKPQGSTAAHRDFHRLDAALEDFLQEVKLAA